MVPERLLSVTQRAFRSQYAGSSRKLSAAFFANAAGEPLARVPLAETIPRIVSAPFLSFLAAKVFRVLRDAAKGSAFGIRKLLKKLEQNFYRLRHSRRERCEDDSPLLPM